MPEKVAEKKYFVFGENVNLRKSASVSSASLLKLQVGEPVSILKKTNELFSSQNTKEYWYEVEAKGKKGFVWGGLLSDYDVSLGSQQVLIRNLGVAEGKIQIKLVENQKILSQFELKVGPVSNENWSHQLYSGDFFSPNPGKLIGIRYLIFSEIEYAYSEETIFSIDSKQKINKFFTWTQGGCDPPSCADTWLVFPGETLKEDKSIKRKKYQGEKNTILEVTRSYNIDDETENSFNTVRYLWNGKHMEEKK
ncbi:SH3 domain protein [Leptospira ryugenii]|uniref:SH3 domain protein n=2 Tax=Leptospira ryugenii TaxID=1917863 RepID=A0A2P2DZD0_9LEPT|nr:SH3 domain protein [Leptospira ryugenii]